MGLFATSGLLSSCGSIGPARAKPRLADIRTPTTIGSMPSAPRLRRVCRGLLPWAACLGAGELAYQVPQRRIPNVKSA